MIWFISVVWLHAVLQLNSAKPHFYTGNLFYSSHTSSPYNQVLIRVWDEQEIVSTVDLNLI